MKKSLYTAAALLSMAASTQAFADASDFKFELHGFISASGYVDSTPGFVLNGQGPLLLLNQPASGGTTTGFDIRQSRLGFSVTGPTILNGATPRGYVEMDFFNLNGPGGYGEVSVVPRLRLAYGELKWGDTMVRFGQDWELLMVDQPTSLAHIAYPVTYFNGAVFWREPGVAVYHTMDVGSSHLETSAQIIKSDWENPYDFGQGTAQQLNVDSGQQSGLPGFELRAKWFDDNKNDFYVAGHWSKSNGNNAASLPVASGVAPTGRIWETVLGKAGGKINVSDFTLKGEAYVGKNLAPLIGEELQFITNNDVHEAGGWAQLSYNINSEYSVHAVYGISHCSLNDITEAGGGRYQSSVFGGMIEYKTGPFAVGPEFYHVTTKETADQAGGANNQGAPDGNVTGNQYMLTANYTF